LDGFLSSLGGGLHQLRLAAIDGLAAGLAAFKLKLTVIHYDLLVFTDGGFVVEAHA
jgi:hypothetical protein